MFPVDLCRGEGLHTACQGEAVVPGLSNHLVVLQEGVIYGGTETGQDMNFLTLQLLKKKKMPYSSVVVESTDNQLYEY